MKTTLSFLFLIFLSINICAQKSYDPKLLVKTMESIGDSAMYMKDFRGTLNGEDNSSIKYTLLLTVNTHYKITSGNSKSSEATILVELYNMNKLIKQVETIPGEIASFDFNLPKTDVYYVFVKIKGKGESYYVSILSLVGKY